jgi:acetylornithine aminotransferase
MDHILNCHEIVKEDFVRGDHCYLYDLSGNKYLDLEAGIWCTVLGHNHPQINKTIKEQLDNVIHLNYRYTNLLAEEAAATLLDTVSLPDGKCIFLSSGSEAVEFAVQAAKLVTGRHIFLTLSDSYLSAYGAAGTIPSERCICFDWQECRDCEHTNGCDNCSKLVDIPFDDIGAFVFEPGNSSGAVRFPPQKLIDAIVKKTKDNNGLLVVDEVTTGLGRTGKWYGFEHYGLEPDVIAIGKGLGNGYPVSAVAIKGDIANELEQSKFHYVQSHQNDPLGCSIALEVIRVIKQETLVERSSGLGEYMLAKLREIKSRHKVIEDVRGRGLLIGIEFKEHHDKFSTGLIYRRMLDKGFLIGYSQNLHMAAFHPALTIEKRDIADLVEQLDHVLEEIV